MHRDYDQSSYKISRHVMNTEEQTPETPTVANETVAGTQETYKPEKTFLTFSGNAQEYFRIWIVNIFLSVVTLGVYSAWATVRNRRYFYGNTAVQGHHFDFHGKPIAILKGRIIAVVVFLAYAFGGDFHPAIPIAALTLMVLGFPWLMVSALRFRLYNTSLRNLRFGYTATTELSYKKLGIYVILALIVAVGIFWQVFKLNEAMVAPEMDFEETTSFLIFYVLFMIAGSLLLPALIFTIRHLAVNHSQYGDTRFKGDFKMSTFYGYFFMALLAGIGMGVLASIVLATYTFMMGTLIGDSLGVNGFWGILIPIYLLLIPVYLFPFAIWKVMTTNYVFDHTKLRNLDFEAKLEVIPYWSILCTNALAAVFSLGLAIPWAKVRMARYQIERIGFTGEFGQFTGHSEEYQTALGDQTGDAFDIEFGF